MKKFYVLSGIALGLMVLTWLIFLWGSGNETVLQTYAEMQNVSVAQAAAVYSRWATFVLICVLVNAACMVVCGLTKKLFFLNIIAGILDVFTCFGLVAGILAIIAGASTGKALKMQKQLDEANARLAAQNSFQAEQAAPAEPAEEPVEENNQE